MTVLLFVSFLAVLMLIEADDIAHGLHIPFNEPTAYWTVVMWVYPVYSAIAFFLFRKVNQTKDDSERISLQWSITCCLNTIRKGAA